MAKLPESEERKKDRVFRAEVASRMILYGIDDATMAVKLRMCTKTWNKRKAHPETMTVKELRALVKTLHMDGNAVASCL